jgi:outer membrane protein
MEKLMEIKNVSRLGSVVVTLLLLLPLAFATGRDARAQTSPLKIGYTDHELIIVNMPDYRSIQEQLQKEYQGSQEEIQSLAKDYQEKLDKYQKQQALLSPERRQEREQELINLQGQIQKTAQEKEQSLAEREAELMRPLFERVQKAIDEAAAEAGLDLVLRSQVGVQPVILYRNEKTIVDITEAVARKLGLDVDGDQAAASSN